MPEDGPDREFYAVDESGSKFTILVVDEEPSIVALLSAMLRLNGYNTIEAQSLREALKFAGNNIIPIDLVLTDVAIGAESGPDLVDQLRLDHPSLPVLYMSAFIDGPAIRIELLRQAEESVFLPFGKASLKEAVALSMRGGNHLRAGA
jgi:DNA-binding NtrC family response regulator